MDEVTTAKRHMVITRMMSFSDKSKCHSKGCKKKDTFTIFVGEYPRLSTLLYGCCDAHLARFTRQAIKLSQKEIRNDLASQKRDERKKAKQILGI